MRYKTEKEFEAWWQSEGIRLLLDREIGSKLPSLEDYARAAFHASRRYQPAKQTESDTPWTDRHASPWVPEPNMDWIPAYLVRELERELIDSKQWLNERYKALSEADEENAKLREIVERYRVWATSENPTEVELRHLKQKYDELN